MEGIRQGAIVHIRECLGQRAEQLCLATSAADHIQERRDQAIGLVLHVLGRQAGQHLVQRFLIAVAWSNHLGQRSDARTRAPVQLGDACAGLIDQDCLALGRQRDSQLLLDPVDRNLDAQLDQGR